MNRSRTSIRSLSALALLAAFFAASLVGCGRPAEPWGKVTGTVTFQGKPVENAIVLFSNRSLGVEMTTFTDSAGQYAVTTANVPGLPTGEYQVCITPYSVVEPTDKIVFEKSLPKTSYPNIPLKYRTLETSGLSATIEVGNNRFDFDMK